MGDPMWIVFGGSYFGRSNKHVGDLEWAWSGFNPQNFPRGTTWEKSAESQKRNCRSNNTICKMRAWKKVEINLNFLYFGGKMLKMG